MAEENNQAMSGAAQGAAAGTAILPGWGTAIGAGVGLVGGYLGGKKASAAQKEAQRLQQLALQQFGQIKVPELWQQELNLNLPEYIGSLTPQTEGTFQMGPSAMEAVSTDPRLEQAQMAALEQLAEIGQAGMTPAEAAALRTARRGAAAEAQAKSAQIMQEMQRRGVAGSGMELAQRLQAAQSGADRLSQENDRIMQMAQERALQAISQGSNVAGQVRGQQFNERSDIARARDAINQFNTQNQQQVQSRNINRGNEAGLRNLSEQQRIGEARTGIQNQQQMHNKGLLQTQFRNQMDKAAGMTQQYKGMADSTIKAGTDQGQMYANIGKGIGDMIASYNKKS